MDWGIAIIILILGFLIGVLVSVIFLYWVITDIGIEVRDKIIDSYNKEK